ncbi:CBS-domain protein-containing membrane protein [Rubellimicrobium mesophilum DSM 19309]|uniref:CBS-domain protein-containing membrane protein n=1 Tax=Rubellimicrobium mesophilum DSM 19309 TaxID=442562 RepID=A0A017HFE9_9RHOB|nr:HPP family protein [Rubellimicrobium mesophilum]EYD72893.1 CBS-domain protein-containing membrane protein [Rubellimicrobium mesophilum DSM 19309]
MISRRHSPLQHALRVLGPAIAAVPPVEALRAGLGALIGLGVAGLLVLSPGLDLRLGLYMIAPFGATSVLIFAVPNSPLAQPWSAVVGNTLAAVVGILVVRLVEDPALRIALAVGLSVVALSLARAVHPPAGAVAMTAAMNPDAIHELGFRFALAPVAVGSALLVVVGIAYAHLTGRRYPFRHYDDERAHRTADHPAVERLGLSEAELTDILRRYRQSLNLGVEDLARLIGAAEMQAASHQAGPLTAADIMSRDLVTVHPDTPLSEVADLFRLHAFTSLPVVDGSDRFLGVIFQLHLIRRAREDSLHLKMDFAAAMARLLDPEREAPVRAADIMAVGTPRVAPTTPVSALLPLLAENESDAVPVMTQDRTIVGIVTQTDLIAALARQHLRVSLASRVA